MKYEDYRDIVVSLMELFSIIFKTEKKISSIIKKKSITPKKKE